MHEGNITTMRDTINEEVIKIYDEKSLTAMTKSELIILCQNMGVFKHNGTKATKSKLIPEILEWQCDRERKIIVSRAGNLDSKVFSNNRDRLDYCLDTLLSAGVPMVSDKQASLHYIHSHLISNHMNTNAAMAAIVMEKCPTITSAPGRSGRTTPVQQPPIGSPPAALNKHELGRMLMCIFMSENAPLVSAIRDKDLEELGVTNDIVDIDSSITPTSTTTASDDEVAMINVELNHGGNIPKGIGVSLEREELDAKRSGAYVDAWEKIAASFNSNTTFTHPDPTHLLAGKVDPNHPTEIRRGRPGQAFKAAFSTLRSQYTLIYNKWSSSGKNGSEDKDGNINLADYYNDNPFDNLDQMAPFSNFSERSKGAIGPEILEFMHSYVSLFPSLAPFVLRLLPPGMGVSEGGIKICKKRKKEKKYRTTPVRQEGNILEEQTFAMRAILQDVTAPSKDEVALAATSLENGRFDQLKKLYDLRKMYLDAGEEEKADKVLEKITKLEVELGLM
jgi:hypothetical protein